MVDGEERSGTSSPAPRRLVGGSKGEAEPRFVFLRAYERDAYSN